MRIKLIIFSFLSIVCVGFSWVAHGMWDDDRGVFDDYRVFQMRSSSPMLSPHLHRVCSPAMQEVPARPDTPTQQKDYLNSFVEKMVNLPGDSVCLRFDRWLTDQLEKINRYPEKRAKFAALLKDAVEKIIAKKRVSGIEAIGWEIPDHVVFAALLEPTLKHNLPPTSIRLDYQQRSKSPDGLVGQQTSVILSDIES